MMGAPEPDTENSNTSDINKLIGDIFWYIEKNDRVNLRKILFLIYFNDSMVYKMTYN